MSAYGVGSFNYSSQGGSAIPPRLVFFGNERIATGVTTNVTVLQSLLDAGYDVAAIVANYERGTSRNPRELEIAEIAKKKNIPLLLPNKFSDVEAQLEGYDAQAGVLVAYGKIIPESVISLFPRGIINIHPSLLPKHRGPTPLESVIAEGSNLTGVTIMALSKAMDAGPIYGQAEYELTGKETKQELADDLLELGAGMLIEILPDILNGSVVAIPQDATAASYDQLIKKDDGVLDWNKTAKRLESEVRAYLDWPKSQTTLAGKEVVVTKAHVLEPNAEDVDLKLTPGSAFIHEHQLHIVTVDGVLVIDALKPAGKKEMPIAAFLAGYGKDL